VAERVGSEWIIARAEAGETVVVEGTQKVKPGMLVTPKPFSPNARPRRRPLPSLREGGCPAPAAKPETKPAAQPAEKR